MRLGALILKNVMRQKTRTLLTLLGISIGIATIIALGAVADGLSATFSGVINSGEADFIVTQAGSSDLAFSRIEEAQLGELAAEQGVDKVLGVNLGVTQIGANPYFMTLGLEPEALEFGGFKITEGRVFRADADELILGKVAASTLDKSVGDTLEVFGNEYDVVGIYESGEQVQDGGAALPLATVQRNTKTEGKVTLAFVKAAKGTDVAKLTARLDDSYSGELVTIKNAEEISRADQGTEIINGATWMISALAIVIGGIGVMNTMIISVFDRVREIGVLKAVGWRRRTVIAMVLGEAVIIGLASVVIGSALAMAVLVPLSQAEAVKAFLTPAYSWALWGRATLVAVLVSIVGGLYPAWKAANLSPIEALRYE